MTTEDTQTSDTPNADVADTPETTFADVAGSTATATASTEPEPDPRMPKVGKTVIVRRNAIDSPAIVAEVTPKMLITAVVLRANHHLVETVKNLREIHPSEKLTGWYWPED